VVTGAASDIGLALAHRLVDEGMRVVLVDLPGPRLDAAASDVTAHAGEDPPGAPARVLAVPADVSGEAAVRRVVAAADQAYGGVDLVSLKAGVFGPTNIPLWEITDADWRWVFGVNFWGVVNGLRQFVLHLLTRDRAHVVITASVAGLVAGDGEAPYVSSKHAVVALAEILRRQLAGSPVGVSLLCPWWVRTDILSSARNRGTASREPLPARRELRDHGLTPVSWPTWPCGRFGGRFYVHTHPDLISAALTTQCAEIPAPENSTAGCCQDALPVRAWRAVTVRRPSSADAGHREGRGP
jgi:NAD(P)-dependent dehydrogenase (short-subunit alcohol dehydrogenase family)